MQSTVTEMRNSAVSALVGWVLAVGAIALAVSLLGLPSAAGAQSQEPTPAELARQDYEQHRSNVERLLAGGKIEEALVAVKELLVHSRRLYGEKSADVAQDLRLMAECFTDLNRFDEARAALVLAREIDLVCFGPKSWQAARGEERLRDLATVEKLTPAERGQLNAVDGQLAELEEQLKSREGPFADRQDAPAAHPAAVEVLRKLFGEGHPYVMLALQLNARALALAGDEATALRMGHAAWLIALQQHPHDPDAISVLQTLASRLTETGDFARAESLYLDLIARQKAAGATQTETYAATLNNLAHAYEWMGDFKQAAAYYRQAYNLFKAFAGPTWKENGAFEFQHLTFLNSATRVGIDLATGRRLLAELHLFQLFKGLDDRRILLLNLATASLLAGNHQQARQYLRDEASERRKLLQQFPEVSPLVDAEALAVASALSLMGGDVVNSERQSRQALALQRQFRPPGHPKLRAALNNLALDCFASAKRLEALGLANECLDITFKNAELCSASQSHRQQLSLSDHSGKLVGTYLSIASSPHIQVPTEDAYRRVLQWKGAISLRTAQARLATYDGGPETRDMQRQLAENKRQLARIYMEAFPNENERSAAELRTQTQSLLDEIDRLEVRLTQPAGKAKLPQPADAVAKLRESLGPNAVLIDIIEYPRFWNGAQGYGRKPWTTAFVVRGANAGQSGPVIEWIDLGASETLALAVDEWRKSYGIAAAGRRNPGSELRKLVWDKLEPLLGDAKSIIISPAGPLAQLPWAALPGKQPGNYLLEERAISYMAVPALLPVLTSRPTRLPVGEKPGMLVVGDVDFGGDPGSPRDFAMSRAAPRMRTAAVDLPSLGNLPGTCVESLAIQRGFQAEFGSGQVALLQRGKATEQAVRENCGKHAYLHFATHGFFGRAVSLSSPGALSFNAQDERDASSFHPSLLSGLVLAGAGRPLDPSKDDGILTALEVEAMDVSNVEMAVLSACDTGLGKAAASEGVLGLSRSFHAGGTRTVVASLWQVSDQATRQLMTDFYENLWKQKLPRAQALRQAQLKMLREGLRTPNEGDSTLEAECASTAADSRGLRRVPDPSTTPGQRTSPFYWAAFVLSGSWE